MESVCTLNEFLTAMEHGCQYHTSIVFFNRAQARHIVLPRSRVIHSTPFCDAMKLPQGGRARCMRCRDLALKKIRNSGQPLSGHCICGLYEYCHPVYYENELCCVIFVGNILKNQNCLQRLSGLAPEDPLIETLQQDMSEEDCIQIARAVESYIHLLLRLEPPALDSPNAIVNALKSYIDQDFCQDIQLEELADLYHYNEKYMGSLFKQHMGVSFHTYLNEKRLEYARYQLRKTRDSITDISIQSGFNTVTYFNRLFKKRYGCSPLQYRSQKHKKI